MDKPDANNHSVKQWKNGRMKKEEGRIGGDIFLIGVIGV
jgi:hypothetical protein